MPRLAAATPAGGLAWLADQMMPRLLAPRRRGRQSPFTGQRRYSHYSELAWSRPRKFENDDDPHVYHTKSDLQRSEKPAGFLSRILFLAAKDLFAVFNQSMLCGRYWPSAAIR
jgi:hypothetical protein